jgi:nucleoid-associated protein YgaU
MMRALRRIRTPAGGVVAMTVAALAGVAAPGAAYLVFFRTDDVTVTPVPAAVPVKTLPQVQAAEPILPSFDAISVDKKGILVAAGKSAPGVTVTLKSGDRILAETNANESGEWVLILTQPLEPGSHVLSLTAKGVADSAIVSGKRGFALTVPQREKPELKEGSVRVAAAVTAGERAPASQRPPDSVAMVKRGDSLWALAHRHLGAGNRYPQIVSANKPQIKNPNLIYPKQQFAIPH